jgi:structural maintenance of chromosome 2
MEMKSKLEKSREQNTADIKKLDSKVDRATSDFNHMKTKLGHLLNENPWVRVEKEMFGNPESAEYANLSSLDVP